MLNLDIENLPRAIRAMKCQALAAELAAMRAKLATAQTDEDRQRCRQASALLEEDIAMVAGTAEQRALEAAQSHSEGLLKEALVDFARDSRPANERAVREQLDRLWNVKRLTALSVEGVFGQPGTYTSDAEEQVKRIVGLLVSNGTSPPLSVLSDIKEIVGVDQ
ncbi:MAG: hypothetical protein E6R03_13950 [Hyphomicrobiaceae bacterium]|nr:MAG: hypothetical protein E6R03_13950 [Hyphomicrobiaceae bacterium]